MDKLEKTLENFKGKKVVVIGDVMLDKYLEGNVTKISPEAPVPIVLLKKEFYELGGAANVASNIHSLGGSPCLFGFVGKDKNADIIKTMLSKKRIRYFLENNSLTTEKTRIIGGGQQLLRFDNEETSEKNFSEQIKKIILEEATESAIILISDYAKGVITKNLIKLLEQFKNKMIIDPKPRNKFLYSRALLITPNEKELLEMTATENITDAGNKLKEELMADILVKRGEKGMSLFSDKQINIPTEAKEVHDVTGAGDSVLSTLALSIASGASIEESAVIANYAAGIVVEKKGTYVLSFNELRDKITSRENTIVQLEELKKIVLDNKRKGRKVVWTNGVFDLLHVGHIRYLKEAKKLGDILIVGINSDESTKKLKGNSRPVQSEIERAEILSAIDFVDHVIIFPELTVENYLKDLQPEIYVKGGDYSLDSINHKEKEAVESYNGKISFVQLVEGKSSSNIIEKVVQGNNHYEP